MFFFFFTSCIHSLVQRICQEILSQPGIAVSLCSGVFVYPLEEKEVVVGFEAMIAGRLVGVQIQSRGKLKDCCLECCPGSGLDGHYGSGQEWRCCCGMSGLDIQCTNGEDERDSERWINSCGCHIRNVRDPLKMIFSCIL